MSDSPVLHHLKFVLKTAGCRATGHSGHTEIWQSSITNCVFPVDSGIESLQSAHAILRQAGLSQIYSDLVIRLWSTPLSAKPGDCHRNDGIPTMVIDSRPKSQTSKSPTS